MASVSVNTAVKTIELFGSAYDEAAREDIAALTARKIEAAGLATGGGDLSADRVITVLKASGADAAAGIDDTSAVTPLALATPLDAIEGAMALLAPLDSPTFTGRPEVPQQALGTADDTAANTAFVAAALADLDWPDDLAAHLADHANPHLVTAEALGLGAVDDTADLDKPVSTATQAAINALATGSNTVAADLAAHAANTNNPHAVDAADVGLNRVANLAPADLPVSTATQAAINALAADADTVAANLATHVANTSNPHGVDKGDVGLGLVANLAPTDLPISTATQTALSALQVDVDTGQADYAGHKANVANPHGTTKSQVGLGSVDNTSDLAKPVSTATQAALNVVQADVDAGQAEVTAHKADHANPHATTASQVGLGLVANLAPADLPISSATQLAINAVAASVASVDDTLAAHLLDTANPHDVDAADVGLGAVDNTADADKPVSSATQAAINVVQAGLAAHVADTSNPHGVDAADIGLDAVDNTSDADKPVSTAQAAAIAVVQAEVTAHKADHANPHSVDAEQVGLGNVANLAPADLPISDATQIAIDAVQAHADAAALAQPGRPGDAPELYGQAAIGEPADIAPVDPAWVVTGIAGKALRLDTVADLTTDPQIVAPLAAIPVQAGYIYQVGYEVLRIVDPVDPLNDSVTLGIQWLTADKASNGTATVEDLALTVAQGVQQRTAQIATVPGPSGTVDFVPPAGTVYFRPYVESFGGAQKTDLLTLSADAWPVAINIAINGLLLPKLPADPATGPGLGFARLYVVQGVGTTAILRMQAGTSTTPIDIVVSVGSGF